jgi:hypothetical protein
MTAPATACICPGPTVNDTTCPLHGEGMLPLWVVYDHPSDYPDDYVARQFVIGIEGDKPTDRMMIGALDSIRAALCNLGLGCIQRSEEDDPVIVECWL